MGKRDLADGGGGKLLGTLANLHVGIDFSEQRVRAYSQDLMPQKKKKKGPLDMEGLGNSTGAVASMGSAVRP